MRDPFGMDCREALDEMFELREESLVPWLGKLRVRVHLLFCSRCAETFRQAELCDEMLRSDFFPDVPSIEDRIMERLPETPFDEEAFASLPGEPGGISFRSWVIVGFFVLVSLTASFFGIHSVAPAAGFDSSFLVFLAVTTGIALTGYGAVFIGSHLKELSTHFKLH